MVADVYQASLLALDTPMFDDEYKKSSRYELDDGAWFEVTEGWVSGSDALFDEVRQLAPWQAHRRVMWNKVVDEPRLSTRHWTQPPPVVDAIAASLSRRYGRNLRSVSANFYRDGGDSVAWHGDTAGRHVATTVVAIVSLGSPRRFLLRPKGGGASIRLQPRHGDLLVLGGTCQHTHDHAVPKMSRAGPRVSLMFREPGVF